MLITLRFQRVKLKDGINCPLHHQEHRSRLLTVFDFLAIPLWFFQSSDDE